MKLACVFKLNVSLSEKSLLVTSWLQQTQFFDFVVTKWLLDHTSRLWQFTGIANRYLWARRVRYNRVWIYFGRIKTEKWNNYFILFHINYSLLVDIHDMIKHMHFRPVFLNRRVTTQYQIVKDFQRVVEFFQKYTIKCSNGPITKHLEGKTCLKGLKNVIAVLLQPKNYRYW